MADVNNWDANESAGLTLLNFVNQHQLWIKKIQATLPIYSAMQYSQQALILQCFLQAWGKKEDDFTLGQWLKWNVVMKKIFNERLSFKEALVKQPEHRLEYMYRKSQICLSWKKSYFAYVLIK